MTTNHDHLREVAERATPGPWLKDKYGQLRNADDRPIDVQRLGVSIVTAGDQYPEALANAELMTMCNPSTILALLDAYEASARDAARYRWLRTNGTEYNTWQQLKRIEEDSDFDAFIDAARAAIGDSHE